MPKRFAANVLWVASLVVLAMLPGVCLAEEVVVIANPSVPASALSQQDVSNIYLGKKTTWDDGSKIVFAVQNGSGVHDAFLGKYLNKTGAQFNTFWKKQMFTGKGSPPPSMDSDQAMIEFVAKTAGAIGYVSPGSDVSNVKTISVE